VYSTKPKNLVLVDHIHLPNNHSGRRNHRSHDQRNIQLTELPLKNVDTLLSQYIPPEQPSQRGAYRKRERPIVGSDRERVNSSITFFRVESVPHSGDPNLKDSSGEDRRPNIGSTYLRGGQAVVGRLGRAAHIAQDAGDDPHPSGDTNNTRMRSPPCPPIRKQFNPAFPR